jgi:hypothetical protein
MQVGAVRHRMGGRRRQGRERMAALPEEAGSGAAAPAAASQAAWNP